MPVAGGMIQVVVGTPLWPFLLDTGGTPRDSGNP